MPETGQYAWLYDSVYQVMYYLASAVLAFRQYDSDLYWPFIVSTIAIALLAWRVGPSKSGLRGAAGWREFRRRYLSRDLWWHPSARADYRYYFINAVVFPLLLGPLLFDANTIAKLLDSVVGAAQSAGSAPSALGARVAYTLLFFVAYDFGRFVAHCLLHDVPWLWEFHKVHHSAEVLTPITSFRAHPVDLAVMAWVPALLTGFVTWIFHRWIEPGIGVYTFLGLHVLIWVFGLVGNLRHWQVWISFGATLNRWLISPAHHQLHHSAEPRHFGCNRGFGLAVWDRMYGTLYVPPDQPETFRMGLGDETDGRWRSLGRLYFWSFGLLAKRLFAKAGVRQSGE